MTFVNNVRTSDVVYLRAAVGHYVLIVRSTLCRRVSARDRGACTREPGIIRARLYFPLRSPRRDGVLNWSRTPPPRRIDVSFERHYDVFHLALGSSGHGSLSLAEYTASRGCKRKRSRTLSHYSRNIDSSETDFYKSGNFRRGAFEIGVSVVYPPPSSPPPRASINSLEQPFDTVSRTTASIEFRA